MKKHLLLLFSLVILAAAFSEEKLPMLSILDFEVSGISEKESLILIDYLSSIIHESGQYKVIDRGQRETILKELEFSLSGCTDEECQLEAGRLLQARYIIVGSMGSVGNRYFLNMKLIDVETGEMLNTSSHKYTSLDAMIDEGESLALQLISSDEISVTEAPAKGESPEGTQPAGASTVETRNGIQEEPKGRRGSSLGPGIMGAVFVDPYQRVPIIGVTGSYLYQFGNFFSLGAWLGLTLILSGPTGIMPFPVGGIHVLFGNKVDGVALGLDLGWFPGISLYYRNFVIWGVFAPMFPGVLFGITIGYNFYFGS